MSFRVALDEITEKFVTDFNNGNAAGCASNVALVPSASSPAHQVFRDSSAIEIDRWVQALLECAPASTAR